MTDISLNFSADVLSRYVPSYFHYIPNWLLGILLLLFGIIVWFCDYKDWLFSYGHRNHLGADNQFWKDFRVEPFVRSFGFIYGTIYSLISTVLIIVIGLHLEYYFLTCGVRYHFVYMLIMVSAITVLSLTLAHLFGLYRTNSYEIKR